MSREHSENDLFEILQNTGDMPLWFAEMQLQNRETASWVVYRFLQHGLAKLQQGATSIPEWKWKAVLENPASWRKDGDHTPILMYTGTDDKAVEFFNNI